MKRKLYEAVALLIALAMLAGLALSEGMLEAPDMGLDIEDAEILEFDEMASPDVVDEVPDDIELSLGALDLKGNVTYRFIVDGVEVATQAARAGEEILRPEAPEAPRGKVFAGWTLADGTPLFADADGDGKIDPVIVRDYELGTEVCVWAVFDEAAEAPTEEEPAEEESIEEESTEEEPAGEEPAEGETSDEGTSSVSPDGEPASPEGKPFEEATEEEPVEEEPAEEEPAEEALAEEAPAEEELAEEAPTEEEPDEEEEPAEEQSVEEELSAEEEESTEEEQPVEEQPAAEEQPAEEQPEEELAEEQLAEEELPAEEEQPAAEEAEATADQKPSPDGEGGSAEALTEEVLPTDTESAPEAEEEATLAEEETVEAQPSLDAPTANNELTYNGEAQKLVNGEGPWLYSLDGEIYSAQVPTAIDAGEYTVYFKASESDVPRTLTVTVAKADVELTPPVVATP